jgi:hypothetical protein
MVVEVHIGKLGTPSSGGCNLEMKSLPPEGSVPINALLCQCCFNRHDKIWRGFRNFVPEFGVDGEAFFGRISSSV